MSRRRTETKPVAGPEQRLAFTAELPGPYPGAPLLQLSVELAEKTEADGGRVRLRAHLHSRLGNVHANAGTATPEAVTAAASPKSSLAKSLSLSIGKTLAEALRHPRMMALAQPLLDHEINSWFELQVSTEPLDGGTAALLPAPERLARMGVVPRMGRDAPIVESWVGEIGHGKGGFAQFSLLRIARDQLPPRLAALLGSSPLQIAAALVNTIEPEPRTPKK